MSSQGDNLSFAAWRTKLILYSTNFLMWILSVCSTTTKCVSNFHHVVPEENVIFYL